MECPDCQSQHIRKNGQRRGKQNHRCVDCGRQFVANPQTHRGDDDATRRLCLKLSVNGLGFRAIERVTGVHHTTVITWVKQIGTLLSDAYDPEVIPAVGELDELQTFVGAPKHKVWIWTAVNHFRPGILAWAMGDRSAKTFERGWRIVGAWQGYFYVTDGWKVYPQFIPAGEQMVSKTDMTRVERENTRLRHYLARLHRKTLCYSKSLAMLQHSLRLLIHYLKFGEVPVPFRAATVTA
ncbi:MAG: IS1 family transposase [Cyanobacteria bacterium J06626_4]